ncbi:hypothetical protein [Flaviflexus equikiangi]|nr:hypothetical protein [Flaviflexus equikiangi]
MNRPINNAKVHFSNLREVAVDQRDAYDLTLAARTVHASLERAAST